MGFSVKWAGAALAMALTMPMAARPQAAAGATDADVAKEAATADALYKSQNLVGALPLYEDLHTRQPESNLWRERLAMSLLGAAAQNDSETAARRERAHKLLLEARAAGDNSNLLQVVLERLEAPATAAPAGPPSPGLDAFKRAEKAFSSGDLPGALKLYAESAAADPKLYEAPLYAGDTEYKQGHYAEAGTWYARAIAINPNRETAYRYWGDCLVKAGNAKEAEGKFIDAVIAEPYTRTTRVGLKQWADQSKVVLLAPAIVLPARAQPKAGADGKITVTVDPALASNPMAAAVIAYAMGSTMFQAGGFAKAYPAEKQYRHSLAEEAQSIRVGLSTLAKQNISPDKMDATWKALAELDAAGMLECWILLDHADQGIAQDYVAYRAEHRDLLHAYIAKYDVHPK